MPKISCSAFACLSSSIFLLCCIGEFVTAPCAISTEIDSLKYLEHAEINSLKTFSGILYSSSELTNIKCKAELVKNDYNPGHVIDAIVLKKFGIKSFGVQHAGTPLDCPQLSFVEFDFYSIWGDFYLKAFHQGWSKINLLKTGREIIDFLININNDRARVESIENEIVKNYGQSKARVIFLFSSPTYLTKKRMWEELHKGFIEIKKLTFDFQIICRFREESHKSHPYIKNTYELIVNDPRFILEQMDFTTLRN